MVCYIYMGISESIMKHTLTCCENICEDVDCEIDSGCCKTHYSNTSPKKTKVTITIMITIVIKLRLFQKNNLYIYNMLYIGLGIYNIKNYIKLLYLNNCRLYIYIEVYI